MRSYFVKYLEREKMENIKIIGTIHGFHLKNRNYTFQHLNEFIENFSPDIIGIEVREEDMLETNQYLKNHYPPEMIYVKEFFEKRLKIVGFDYRGEELKNKKIEFWNKYNQQIINSKDKKCSQILARKRLIFTEYFTNYSLVQCQELLNKENIIEELEEITKEISSNKDNLYLNFSLERDNKILENIKKIINENPYKRILILTGFTHLYDIKKRLFK